MACGSDHIADVQPTPPGSGKLIPLDIGTRWTYQRVDSVEFTTSPSDKSFHTITDFGVIADTTDRHGNEWAVLDHSNYILGGLLSGHNYVANEVGGVYDWSVPTGSDLDFPAFLDFPYPTTRGATSNFGIVKVLSTDTVITVPAGTFHCLLYAEADDRVFVAPGVGVVWRSLGISTVHQGSLSGPLILQMQTFFLLKAIDKPAALGSLSDQRYASTETP